VPKRRLHGHRAEPRNNHSEGQRPLGAAAKVAGFFRGGRARRPYIQAASSFRAVIAQQGRRSSRGPGAGQPAHGKQSGSRRTGWEGKSHGPGLRPVLDLVRGFTATSPATTVTRADAAGTRRLNGRPFALLTPRKKGSKLPTSAATGRRTCCARTTPGRDGTGHRWTIVWNRAGNNGSTAGRRPPRSPTSRPLTPSPRRRVERGPWFVRRASRWTANTAKASDGRGFGRFGGKAVEGVGRPPVLEYPRNVAAEPGFRAPGRPNFRAPVGSMSTRSRPAPELVKPSKQVPRILGLLRNVTGCYLPAGKTFAARCAASDCSVSEVARGNQVTSPARRVAYPADDSRPGHMVPETKGARSGIQQARTGRLRPDQARSMSDRRVPRSGRRRTACRQAVCALVGPAVGAIWRDPTRSGIDVDDGHWGGVPPPVRTSVPRLPTVRGCRRRGRGKCSDHGRRPSAVTARRKKGPVRAANGRTSGHIRIVSRPAPIGGRIVRAPRGRVVHAPHRGTGPVDVDLFRHPIIGHACDDICDSSFLAMVRVTADRPRQSVTARNTNRDHTWWPIAAAAGRKRVGQAEPPESCVRD